MPRYLVDLDVESHATLAQGLSELHHHDGAVEVFVKSRDTKPGAENAVLEVQLVFDAATIVEAKERGVELAKDLLRAWTFSTSMSFRISAVRRIVDWSPGLRERECIQFSYHPSFDRPYPALDSATLGSAIRVLNSDLSATLRRAVRWHANGVTSEYTDDQFYYFWLAIELIAIETRAPEPVHDACPKCRGPLFCKSCGVAPTHKPYPKQAIRATFQKHVTDHPDKFFEDADAFRNAMMHGEDLIVVEKTRGVAVERIVNALGHLSWAAVLSTLISKLAAAGQSGELPVLQTNLFVHYQMNFGLNMVVTSRDPDRPCLSDLPKIEMSLESGAAT
jgi:hypothetical protein